MLLLDKPAGPTSHDVVAAVRRALGMRRVGHVGTLDPFATGLLPVLAGRATRLAPYLVGLDKTYTGTLRLGVETDTHDLAGTVQGASDTWRGVDDARLADAMQDLTGTLEQTPPAYSAKKVAGTPAHRRLRRGETVTLAPRSVTVHRFALTGRSGPDVTFTAEVASGTYIRALARDLGRALGCGAHLTALRRTVVGPWRVSDATALTAFVATPVPPAPPLAAVPHLPLVVLSDAEQDAVRHGRTVPAREPGEGPVALVAGGALVAVAERDEDVWRPRVVLEAA